MPTPAAPSSRAEPGAERGCRSASSEIHRLLIVDDIAETRENLRKLLQFESDIEVVGAARTGEEALQMARDTQPDVVLMDINMPDMDGIAVTEALLARGPVTRRSSSSRCSATPTTCASRCGPGRTTSSPSRRRATS